MTFDQVIDDIKKMIGIELCSVRPGANVTIIAVDEERDNLILRTAKGVKRSRPLSELRCVWEEMQLHSAVHVDEVLHGSGTSRNQPETIMANLPYVEWLKVSNKKHIAYVGKATHPYGTLREMSPIDANSVIHHLTETVVRPAISAIIITADVAHDIESVRSCYKGVIDTIEAGIYQFRTECGCALFIASGKTDLVEGTYGVIAASRCVQPHSKRVDILGDEYDVVCNAKIKLLVKT